MGVSIAKSHKHTGAASLYIVIFTTILMGVITLSFIRIMLSEATQTSNSDLSQSAYDSAMAGVEDAKTALLQYHECLSRGVSASVGERSCADIIKALEEDAGTDCDILRKMLNRAEGPVNKETIIQTETNNAGTGATASMEQAYTCVRITEELVDYRSRLYDDYRTKIVPIRTASDAELNAINYIQVSWYSAQDYEQSTVTPPTITPTIAGVDNKRGYGNATAAELFDPRATYTTPPTNTPPAVSVNLMQADTTFTLSQFDTNSDANTDRGTLVLVPSTSGLNTLLNSKTVGFAASSDKAINNPVPVKCSADANNETPTGWRCSINIQLPKPYGGGSRNPGATFLQLALLYGSPPTSFGIALCRDAACRDIVPFKGVQAKVDSTGRANDLYRRIEARVELADIYFPYPEQAFYSETGFRKNFWVTTNNWYGPNSGEL